MRGVLYKSKLIFTIFVAVAVLFTLAGVSFAEQRKNARPADFLSDQFVVFEIYNAANFTEQDLLRIMERNCGDGGFLCMKKYTAKEGCSIYFSPGMNCKIRVTEGRSFSRKDFDEGKNVAIVTGDRQNQPSHIFVSQKRYDVIGSCSSQRAGQASDWFINMNAENLKNKRVYGYYFFDTDRQDCLGTAKKIAGAVKDACPTASVAAEKGMSRIGRGMRPEKTNYTNMLGFLIATAVLVLLNSFSACYYWLETRKKEIAIRKMAGARGRNIVAWLCREYVVILLLAFFTGVVLSELFLRIAVYLPVANSVELMFGTHISLPGTLSGMALLALIGAVVITATLKRFGRNAIASRL